MSNISYPKYKLPSDLSVNTLTASNHVSASYLYGDGSGLTNLPGTGGGLTSVSTAGNITGSGISLDPVGIKPDPQFNTITASNGFTGSFITVSEANVDHIDFNITSYPAAPPPTAQLGRIFYNGSNGDLSTYLDTNGLYLNNGQQLIQKCHNTGSTTLTKGTVVHITGSTNSDTPYIVKADWATDSLSANTLGVVMSDIASTQLGYVLVQGTITGIDLSHLSERENGQILYLSSSGNITNSKPAAPYHNVVVGQLVAKASVGTGNNATLYVNIQNGYEISELHDVSISAGSNGDLLSYNSNTSTWKNTKFLSGSYSLTGSLSIGSGSAAVNKHSFAIGQGSKANSDFSFANGFNCTTAAGSEWSHAEGQGSQTIGPASHAEGLGSEAIGSYSHAEGNGSKAHGPSSHAEGLSTEARGLGSHSEGSFSITHGDYSHAEGEGTIAYNTGSHAEGLSTIASASHQHVQGKYNATSSTALMLVGNGTNTSTRSNILEVYNDRVVISGSLYATGQNYSRPNDLIALTQLTSSGGRVTHTIPTGANFTVINLNSDGTQRYAKTTFIAPPSGMVSIQAKFDMTIVNSGASQMIGLNLNSSPTTAPSEGWYKINADNDATSGQFYAIFNLLNLTPGTSYTYYFMGVCDFTGNTIRASAYQSTPYTPAADLPGPFNIFVYDLGSVSILTNPSS